MSSPASLYMGLDSPALLPVKSRPMCDCGRRRIFVKGTVQGVGFRPFVYRLASELCLSGFVFNTPEGVTIEAQGFRPDVETLIARISAESPPLARIRGMDSCEIPIIPESDAGASLPGVCSFRIVESESGSGAATGISPDIAPCADCLRELFDANDRRHRYPFINCTNCGPRYTIIEGLPYDRPKTTMRSFEMCARCEAEYLDPKDRRFHAQPDACFDCGPKLQFLSPLDSTAGPFGEEALCCAMEFLCRGGIVAIKGVGGFHLACDPQSDDAVVKLRRRKMRDEKPFALMVRDLDVAEELCFISEAEGKLLESPRRPIVLLRRRGESGISGHVAPGNKNLGIMLPSSPLHHLLFEGNPSATGGFRALVMTSANITDEPIAFENEEALCRLRKIAEAALIHDRAIRARVEDSVARVVEERPMLVRRARGYVPEAISLGFDMPPIFAAGADMKGAVCFAKGRSAWLSEHLGDLGNVLSHRAFEESVSRLGALLDISPEIVACDMHPNYFSSLFARRMASSSKLKLVEVQHHHAHIVSCMAENDLSNEKNLGIALDGAGFGPDGTIWGGEIIAADYAGFTRLARFKPVPMPGGDAASREPWRMAVAYALSLSGAQQNPIIDSLGESFREKSKGLGEIIDREINCPLTSSCGRLFDAISAIAGLCAVNSFEGQAAMLLEQVSDEGEEGIYEFDIMERGELLEIDFKPTAEAAAREVLSGVPASLIGARFHNALVDALAKACGVVSGRFPRISRRACLSGGCFQNALLLSRLRKRLELDGFTVYTHSLVPAGDGGVALGQAIVASRRFSESKRG